MCDESCSEGGGKCKESTENNTFNDIKGPNDLPSGTSKFDENILEKVTEVFDLIRDIRDPEKDQTLEELNVVAESLIDVQKTKCGEYLVTINFTPTVPHCSLATLIGLCLRVKLNEALSWKHKIDIFLTKGSHDTENEINKQINDKERVAAAMENPNLRNIVDDCLKEPE